MKEEFIKKFTKRTSEHLQACFGPKLKKAQISRIVLMHLVEASADTGVSVDTVRTMPVHGGEVTILINEDISVIIPLEKRKEAAHV